MCSGWSFLFLSTPAAQLGCGGFSCNGKIYPSSSTFNIRTLSQPASKSNPSDSVLASTFTSASIYILFTLFTASTGMTVLALVPLLASESQTPFLFSEYRGSRLPIFLHFWFRPRVPVFIHLRIHICTAALSLFRFGCFVFSELSRLPLLLLLDATRSELVKYNHPCVHPFFFFLLFSTLYLFIRSHSTSLLSTVNILNADSSSILTGKW